MGIKERLQEIVGEGFVNDGAAERYIYSQDMTENITREPIAIVMPETVEEIQSIIKMANETKTPLIPYVTGQNVGGLTIPQVDGSVIVDLRRLNRIIEVDEDAMYALIEPGVTFGHMRKYLDDNHPDLRYAYLLAPPHTSVMANALLQGLGDLSNKHGAMGDFINGLEAVLPTGELVRAGSGIMGDNNWFGRYPLPDLVGLFSGWQGMTGIVTKVAVQLWPKPPILTHVALFTFGEKETADLLIEIGKKQIVENADCMSLSIIKMLLDVSFPVQTYDGEPDFGTVIAISGNTEVEVAEKIVVLNQIVHEAKQTDSRHLLVTWDAIAKLMGDQANAWVNFPSDAFKVLAEFDGLTWCGAYFHPKNWGTALAGGREIVERHGFELMAFLKPMNSMHFGELKFIIRFPKDDETLNRVRKCNEELFDFALDLNAIPYKTPVWAAKKMHERIDPGFLKLIKKIKETLDPNNIFNPGRWGL